jgi:hypothetical protein
VKIASLFVELGFKVEGSDLDSMRSFETTLSNIAASAERAVAALKQLGMVKIKLPRTPAAAAATPGAAPATTTPTPSAPSRPLPGMMEFIGPVKPPTPPPAAPASGTFGSSIFAGLSKAFPGLKMFAQLGALGAVVALLSKAVTSATTAIIRMSKAALDSAVSTDKARATTGLSVGEIKGFEMFAAKAGINSDAVVEAAKSFQTAAQEIRYGGGDPTAFGFAGINPFQPVAGILKDFVNQTKDLPTEEARYRAQRIGINDELFSALRLYGPEISKALDSSLMLSDEQQKNTREAAQALSELTLAVKMTYDAFFADLAPLIRDIANGLRSWLLYTPSKNLQYQNSYIRPMAPALTGKIGSGTSQNNVTVNADIQVDGAKNPTVTAELISRELKRSLSDAYYQSPAYQGINY